MPAPSDGLVGRLVDGRYEVQAPVARGGTASVYRARDTRLDRVVALKVMHPQLAADADFAARFVSEARAAARLNHSGVVAVFDQGAADSVVYLAMEYVAGRTLRDVVTDEAPLRPLRTLQLVERILDALAVAHRGGIVHGDVKPENVLIGADGSVKVADFGLARAISAGSTATATTGMLIGTVSYLAPELVLGAAAGTRSDVYAVGIVCYELLCARLPHLGQTPIQVAYRHVHDGVPAPSACLDLDWPIPDFVDALVARATNRDPAARPSDADVLLRQVRRVLAALQAGVRGDADLAEDLRPPRALTSHEVETLPQPTLHPPPAPPVLPPQPPDERHHTLVIGLVATEPPPAAAPTAAPRRRPGEPAAPRRRRRRGLLWLVIVLVLALLAGLAGWWAGTDTMTRPPRQERQQSTGPSGVWVSEFGAERRR